MPASLTAPDALPRSKSRSLGDFWTNVDGGQARPAPRCPTPVLSAILLALSLLLADGRTFTDVKGRTIEAEFVRADETEVVLKVTRTQRKYRIKIETLSEADARYVERRRGEDAFERAKEVKRLAAVKRVYDFVRGTFEQKVGNGQCWTLADAAYRHAEIERPGPDLRVWGGLVDWKNDAVRPGDILELRSARFPRMVSGPEHTAVVMKVLPGKGKFVVYHQNWGLAGMKVSQGTFDLTELISGQAMIYRYGIEDQVAESSGESSVEP